MARSCRPAYNYPRQTNSNKKTPALRPPLAFCSAGPSVRPSFAGAGKRLVRQARYPELPRAVPPCHCACLLAVTLQAASSPGQALRRAGGVSGQGGVGRLNSTPASFFQRRESLVARAPRRTAGGEGWRGGAQRESDQPLGSSPPPASTPHTRPRLAPSHLPELLPCAVMRRALRSGLGAAALVLTACASLCTGKGSARSLLGGRVGGCAWRCLLASPPPLRAGLGNGELGTGVSLGLQESWPDWKPFLCLPPSKLCP